MESAEAGSSGRGSTHGGLAQFLRQFVLIKTPHGYILGRNQRGGDGGGEGDLQVRERRLPSPRAESNFQLRVRKAPPAERNFQLRVRKRASMRSPQENNFQLRVSGGYYRGLTYFQSSGPS